MQKDIALSAYFTVELKDKSGVGLVGSFFSVSGLGMEYEYETYLEGGATVPVQLFKGAVPQRLVLSQGTVYETDKLSQWMDMIGSGICLRLTGTVTLRSAKGDKLRSWIIHNAYPARYEGPALDSMQSAAAVSQIEFIYGGCS